MPREDFVTSFDGNKIRVYIPDDNVRQNGVIVIHEIWGLEDHIKDVAGRFVKEGYFAVAPQLFSRQEDILKPKNIESVMVKVWSIPPEQRSNLEALKKIEESLDDTGKKIFEILVKNRPKLEEQMVKDLIKIYEYVTRHHMLAPLTSLWG
ncbi:MAG: dienelactone hydrolase family protein [Sulfolobaceae archaeon]